MKQKIVLTVLSVVALTSLAVRPAVAFSPIDWVKAKLTPDQATVRASNQSDRVKAMAKSFKMSEADVQAQLDAGEKPYAIAAKNGSDIAAWRNSRIETMRAHRLAMGYTEQEVDEFIKARQARWESGTMGQGNGSGQHMQGMNGQGMGKGRNK